ncbi:MAG TPA: N-acetylmuramoyl-L-alanine amidase [Mobilitalea sp.]|mgnify:FL=1|nr:N-acetylmuramoyl-L-alanine amidase [Mobilitalea sp.]
MAVKINIDAGHGSNTAGKRTPPFPYEVVINDKITVKKGEQFREHIASVGVSYYLEQELKRHGFETTKTGWNDSNAFDDPDTPLGDRQAAIKKAKCDYSISVHFNAYGDGKDFNSASGVGIYIHDKYPGQSKKMAETVLKNLMENSGQNNRGVTAKALGMCNCNSLGTKAAILIELTFMTNLREAVSMMANEAFWKESARKICKGICEYTGVKYISDIYFPAESVTPESSKTDIRWAQERLNIVLPQIYDPVKDIIPLKVDGSFGPKTRIAVLLYWDALGWGKHMNDDGTRIGKSTREALVSGTVNKL